ncbi:hypothetical protein AAL_01814 [Moelleriella libera RCEF 2490]|uniref:Uncharacterized protein n=1 Tax=Moelleriella libera RCEF 2490 TaxID=1081109 RepID=A0A166UGT4_9HYPO|nr:hypothetical protein AAL_01814 [Moelleriella libera RCEF 2490]
MEKFGPLRWAPTEPEMLDYAQAQVLLIGDKTDLGKAVEEGKTEGGAAKKEAGEEDQEEGEGEDPVAVLQDLESQDVDRMKHLSENEADAIYEDLKSQALSHGDIQKEF